MKKNKNDFTKAPYQRKGRLFLKSFLFLGLFWAILFDANAQISIAPTSLFIHPDDQSARITIRNSGETAQEVNINTRFGYPASDEEGNLQMVYDDEAREARCGLDSHLRIFPRRFVLLPGEFQQVRFQIHGIDNRPDGLYWTRVDVTSSEVAPEIDRTQTEGIGTRISYRIRQNIGVFYHKGNVTTALQLNELVTERISDELVLRMRLESGGNSPFLGTMSARLFDNSGNEVFNGEWLFSVFQSRYWPHRINVEGLNQGRYRLDLEFKASRSDIRQTDIPSASTHAKSIFIQL